MSPNMRGLAPSRQFQSIYEGSKKRGLKRTNSVTAMSDLECMSSDREEEGRYRTGGGVVGKGKKGLVGVLGGGGGRGESGEGVGVGSRKGKKLSDDKEDEDGDEEEGEEERSTDGTYNLLFVVAVVAVMLLPFVSMFVTLF